MTQSLPQHSSDLQFGDDDKWEVDPVYAERDRYRSALERIESHGAGYAVKIAREALAKTGKQETP